MEKTNYIVELWRQEQSQKWIYMGKKNILAHGHTNAIEEVVHRFRLDRYPDYRIKVRDAIRKQWNRQQGNW